MHSVLYDVDEILYSFLKFNYVHRHTPLPHHADLGFLHNAPPLENYTTAP